MTTDIQQLDLSQQYTYADYLKWRLQERIELIRGYVFRMSPAPSRQHQAISRNLGRQLDAYLQSRHCEWYSAPFDVRLTRTDKRSHQEITTVVQPDICVICDPAKLDDRGCIGAPDLIVEILSPGNSKKEMKDKFEVYEENGVREYWLVDIHEHTVLVYTLNQQGQYIGHRPFIEDETMHSFIFPDLTIDLTAVFNL